MLARIRGWWSARSRVERLLVGVGAPLAAVAALWGARQDKARKAAAAAEEGLDAEGGPGDTATFVTGGVPINAGAPGVGFDQLGQFTEVFTGELGALNDRVEQEFANSATERARRAAEQEARFGELEERINQEAERPPSTSPTVPVPTPGAGDLETARQEFRDKFGIEPNPLESAAKLRRRIADAGTTTRPAPTPAPLPAPGKGGATTTYTVKRGDTLAAIGSRFGVPWRSILAANPASLSRPGDVRTLKVGYRLTIPAA